MTRPSSLLSLLSLVTLLLPAACTDPARHPTAQPDAAPPPASALYALRSDYDLARELPGEVGAAIDEIIAATDDPDDPTRFVVDRVIAKMADGTLKDLARAAEPFVTAYVNERLLARSPQLLARLVAIGKDFGVAAHQLGTLDTLVVTPDGRATHAIAGVRVALSDRVVELGFAEHGLPVVSAGVPLAADAERVTLGRHTLTLSLGRVLRLVIDGAIVPHVDPGAVDLVGVLQGGLDCAAFGKDMATALGFGAADGYAAACRDAVTDAVTSFYAKLDAADADGLTLEVAGSALAIDHDGDGRFDELANGAWLGTVTYAGAPVPLAGGTFSGARVE